MSSKGVAKRTPNIRGEMLVSSRIQHITDTRILKTHFTLKTKLNYCIGHPPLPVRNWRALRNSTNPIRYCISILSTLMVSPVSDPDTFAV